MKLYKPVLALAGLAIAYASPLNAQDRLTAQDLAQRVCDCQSAIVEKTDTATIYRVEGQKGNVVYIDSGPKGASKGDILEITVLKANPRTKEIQKISFTDKFKGDGTIETQLNEGEIIPVGCRHRYKDLRGQIARYID